MLLGAVRRWSRVVAALLVCAALPGVPHVGPDDLACAGAEGAVRHHETEHGLNAGADVTQDHCAVCHWTRTLRSPIAPAGAWTPQSAPRGRVDRPAARTPASPALDNRSARAPPATQLPSVPSAQ